MRRLLDIILFTIFLAYFLSNQFINMVGAPLAAYHSYQSWKDIENNNHSELHIKDKPRKLEQDSILEKKDK